LWLYWRSLPGLHYLLRDESMGRGELWLFCGVGFGVLRVILYIRHVCREPTVRRSLADCLLYISFFPVFRLGPVIGPDSLSTAIDAIPHRRSPALVRSGLRWFGVGMLKQIIGGCVIELYFQTFFPPGSRPLLRELFDPSTHAAVWQYWVGAFLFHLRIYCMFSGYSDLARGMCNIIGLTTPDNFVLPFLSPSLTTMWQRWHRTFGLWLRDLIYIPLGGNQRQGGRNLFVTFLYAGLWHFPYLNGLTFAAINVSVLMFERVFGRWWQRQRARRTLPYRLLRYLRIADGPVGVALRVGAANMVMAAAGACVLDYHYGGIHLLAGMLGLRSGG
jgi:D-alanyl-lipoteichoic acid acyltransferase DltB (MBOAT superfamily)